MTRARRWSTWAAGIAALLLVPFAVGHLPAGHSSYTATDLWRRIIVSGDRAFSGYAESQGSLQLPVSSDYNSVADLVGGRTELRAWWRNASQWRVDTIAAFGESDTARAGDVQWTWDYERQRATRITVDARQQVRLPTTTDVLPPELGRRLLSQAQASELTRLPNRRVAGVEAPGLRLRPAQPASSISTVDVWADPATGLPLRVEVTGTGQRAPAVTSAFLDFSRDRPTTAATTFTPVTRVRDSSQLDVASAVDRFAPVQPPASLAGLSRSPAVDGLGAVGVYGRGVTELVAVPLRGRLADPLRTQLRSTAPIATDGSVALSVGPLHLLLTAAGSDGRSWLLTGTVTAQTLSDAAADLARTPPTPRSGR